MNVSSVETFEDNKYILNRTKFIILITLQIPSIIISLFIFAFFITHRTSLTNLQTQAIICLLVVNFVFVLVDLPMSINFYRLGYVNPATGVYCIWWTFFEFTLTVIVEFLMATISIQRHILTFQAHILQIRFKRYVLYYIPLLLSIVYPLIFYMAIVVLYPCNDPPPWDFASKLCGAAVCYIVYNQILTICDWVINTGLPIITIILANTTLVIRFIKQKHRLQRRISWKKQRRMILQLLAISGLYLIAWFPSLIIGIILQINPSSFLFKILTDYTSDFIYFVSLLLPWVCLGLLSEFMKWIRKHFRHGRIIPNTVATI